MDFTNLESLARHLENVIMPKALKATAPTITQTMSDVIKEVEYLKYTPTEYVRLGDDGGLSDVRLMQVEILNDNTLSITNERMAGSTDVAEIFATGIGYTWKHSEIYKNPIARDFYRDTVERLLRNHAHLDAMKLGLKAQGIEVE